MRNQSYEQTKNQIESEYNLELNKVINAINKQKAKIKNQKKLVCIQLPDGLKPKATQIASFIEDKTKSTCLIWLGSCFGACDMPVIKQLNVDMLIQFGHSSLTVKHNRK